MSGLKDFSFLTAYNKAEHDIANQFYIPCMRCSIKYDRISGYFGSTIYIIAWDGLRDFIEHDGKIRLICSPYVSDEDALALSEGYSAKNNVTLAQSIEKEVKDLFENSFLEAPAKLLAYMVSKGIIDVKIAVPGVNAEPDARRLFHDKVGVFTDCNGFKVGFRGSMNETFKGLSSDGNMESIDVFPDWIDSRDAERVNSAAEYFEKIWAGSINGIWVYRFPEAAKEILRTKSNGVKWKELLDEIQTSENYSYKWMPCKRTGYKIPKKHQTAALENWKKNNRRGILKHATGSGKTFTAICAIHDAIKKNEVVLVFVPSRDLLEQWNREIREALPDDEIHYLLCGDNNNEWKNKGGLSSWTRPGGETHRIIIATMDTASSPEFLSKLFQGEHLFIVADEVHRIGSKKRRQILSINSGPRLGLSATPYRFGDREGSEAIFSYFGKILEPEYSLKDAIHDDVLTRYYYHPLKITLSENEQQQWDTVTKQISKLMAKLKTAGISNELLSANNQMRYLLIKRARIVKNASGKVPLAIELLQREFKKGQSWIIYCDNIDQLKAVRLGLLSNHLDVFEYYAEMRGDREETLKYFAKNGGILVSIKCLDEGVDIPSTTHALILASSQNPREFIQRRGRILRKSEGKLFAHLYDAITVPIVECDETPKALSIIAGELSRSIQFGLDAENPACVTDLKNIALDFKIDFNSIQNTGIEEDSND